MKHIGLPIHLSAILLDSWLAAACQPALHQTGGSKLQNFTSQEYGYKVSYPSAWSMNVNSSGTSGPGADPEFVTFQPG